MRVGSFKLRRLTLADVEQVYSLSTLAGKATGRLQVNYLKDLATVLGDSTRPFGWILKRDLQHLNGMLKAHGLMKESTVKIPAEQLQDKLNGLISTIAVRLNMTSYQLKQNATPDELERDSVEVIRRDLTRTHDMIMAYHAPKETAKEIKKGFDKLKSQARRLTAKVQKEENQGIRPKGKVLDRRPMFTALTVNNGRG